MPIRHLEENFVDGVSSIGAVFENERGELVIRFRTGPEVMQLVMPIEWAQELLAKIAHVQHEWVLAHEGDAPKESEGH